MAVAVLALIEARQFPRLSLDAPLAALLPACADPRNALGGATLRRLLSMSSAALDNRLNAVRARQLHRRGAPTDHVGWPPLCDELGLAALDCAEQFVCPSYDPDDAPSRAAHPRTRGHVVPLRGLDAGPLADLTCEDAHAACGEHAARGMCRRNPRYMRWFCPRACRAGGGCGCGADGAGDAAGGACARSRDRPRYYAYELDEPAPRLTHNTQHSCVYDNYGYTLVEAAVQKVTGRPMLHWVDRFVYGPMGMAEARACAAPPGRAPAARRGRCYDVPGTINATLRGAGWPEWRGGPASGAWISNALHASAEELAGLVEMLLGNGTFRGRLILSPQSVDAIFTAEYTPTSPLGTCMTNHEFGLGVGYCRCRGRGWGALVGGRQGLPWGCIGLV